MGTRNSAIETRIFNVDFGALNFNFHHFSPCLFFHKEQGRIIQDLAETLLVDMDFSDFKQILCYGK